VQDPRPQLAQAVLVAVHLSKRRRLTLLECDRFLAAYGIPCARRFAVAGGSGADRAAAELGFPVTLTIETKDRRESATGLANHTALGDAITTLYADADQHDPTLMFYVSPTPTAGTTVRFEIPTGAPTVSDVTGHDAVFNPLVARLQAIVADLPEVGPLEVTAILEPKGKVRVVDATIHFDLTR
jgi:hypothetical protein